LKVIKMKYKVSGMFECIVEAKDWREAKVEGARRVSGGGIKTHVISVEEVKANEENTSDISSTN